MERPTISAVIPTLNEEANLEYLLPTISWCDEIILVDQGSEDKTNELAKKHGARVLDVEWQPVFDAYRAVGAEAATAQWILQLDADEMVPHPLADRLMELATKTDVDIVAIPRLNYLLGPLPAGGLWPDYQFRFFRKGAVNLTAEIHTNYKLLSDRVLYLPLNESRALHHFNYRGASSFIAKLDHYTDLEAQKNIEGTVNASSNLWRGFCWEPIRVFLSRYIKQRGFRHGLPGLWISVYWSFYYFVKAIKVWERKHLPKIRVKETQVRDELVDAWAPPPTEPTGPEPPQ